MQRHDSSSIAACLVLYPAKSPFIWSRTFGYGASGSFQTAALYADPAEVLSPSAAHPLTAVKTVVATITRVRLPISGFEDGRHFDLLIIYSLCPYFSWRSVSRLEEHQSELR
ncbi:hypothetical protein ACFFHJ_25270 [Planotetraspora thailandica]|uniref:hypothetical protein n=1 Tax=Planotetraspora thailandica TaxID=487172 RepID=UPI00194F952A|nr:hypothetical protein [Planotetraspora thailandica]